MQVRPSAVTTPGAGTVVPPAFAHRGLRSGVANGKGPVRCRLPVGQGGVAGHSSSRHVNSGVEKNGDAVEFGQRQGAPLGSGELQVDL
jgi:hypothetical protein